MLRKPSESKEKRNQPPHINPVTHMCVFWQRDNRRVTLHRWPFHQSCNHFENSLRQVARRKKQSTQVKPLGFDSKKRHGTFPLRSPRAVTSTREATHAYQASTLGRTARFGTRKPPSVAHMAATTNRCCCISFTTTIPPETHKNHKNHTQRRQSNFHPSFEAPRES